MKQDLIDMKSSQNMGVNLKRKVESFLAAIDVNKRDNEETSSGSRKKQKSRPSTSTTDESEINDLFNPETQPTNQPLFSNLPTRIQDIEPSDFEVEVKHPYILNQHQHFSEATLKDIRKDVAAKFAIQQKEFDANTKSTIEKILKTLVRKIPACKFSSSVRENVISNLYADAILSPMFTNPDKKKHLFWYLCKFTSRTAPSQQSDESAKQPDFVSKQLKGCNWVIDSIVGEVKGEDVKEDKYMCIKDLIRVAFISVTSINDNLFDSIIGVHIVGLQITFYVTTLVADSLYLMMEICSFQLPRDASNLMNFTTTFDDLMLVMEYADKCVVSKQEEKLKEMLCDGIATPEFARFLSLSKDRRRECPIVYHH
ncbi:hypothetical protein FB192DRAFT_1342671 [Mucor lusitanicus]|uniref:Uncharacterized protein n=2 Tax=Mucor circinelloides f. lusitanicus TaxID=29924 RepID=A0A168HAM4_MUCCL|nr:hypothetical protein FB192DRAFT_1342671 [Mucor lusitanicus]OAC98570.1 hypothetical protein MUCCIDRAFT_86316 [Mucor lusitanicus CBS 277.49]